MTLFQEDEILSNLCVRDPLNPNFKDLYGWDEEDITNPPTPRDDCACDNCFYGRDKLALQILDLRERVFELTRMVIISKKDK